MKSGIYKLLQKGGGWGKRRERERKGEVRRGKGIKINQKKTPKGPGQSLDIIKEIKTLNWNKTQSEFFPICVHVCAVAWV